MAEQAKNPDELGALWKKTGAKGEYLTGTINGVPVVVFKNERKVEGSKQPDWRVLKSKPREDRVVERPNDADSW
jgi:hypothetical protein